MCPPLVNISGDSLKNMQKSSISGDVPHHGRTSGHLTCVGGPGRGHGLSNPFITTLNLT